MLNEKNPVDPVGKFRIEPEMTGASAIAPIPTPPEKGGWLGKTLKVFGPGLVTGAADRMDTTNAERIGAMTAGRDWIWITGNHDPEPPASWGGTVLREVAIGNVVLRHQAGGEIVGEVHAVVPVVGTRHLLDVLSTAGGLPPTEAPERVRPPAPKAATPGSSKAAD